MSQYIELFLDPAEPLLTRTFKVNEKDWQLIDKVYPEIGFKSYFPGFAIKTLTEILKEHNITDCHARFRHPNFATTARLLSDLDAYWKEGYRDVGRRAG